MSSYLLEWVGINDLGATFVHRIFVIALDEETARRDLVGQVLLWGCQVRKIKVIGKCPVQTGESLDQ